MAACEIQTRCTLRLGLVEESYAQHIIGSVEMSSEVSRWPGINSVLHRIVHSYNSLKEECEEATEVETHHQQTAATTMGVAEDETPSSLTSHPNTNNPNQEGKHYMRA
ncbi:PREDICTED: uncharacterized protein LOC106740745 [Dinoponera quadriceps]|uniref:Uncharacterized protein LOC106740745 n=1 Tax=Dinoponera quadriceps TaxID=609295 RepID=A0A6P3WN65_DINQU|nr:PREDICTED: uncharacterized protein LOC106740745 [Dinoponera quadriceps]